MIYIVYIRISLQCALWQYDFMEYIKQFIWAYINFLLSVKTEVIILNVVEFALGLLYVGSVANFSRI
jgi:hypothetical protein